MSQESHTDPLREALQRLPAPSVRPGFVDEALARAAAAHERKPERAARAFFSMWQAWVSAAAGAAVAAVATFLVMQPRAPMAPEAGVTLALNESRNVDVLIDSERTLEDAIIRVVTSGAVELEGLDDKHAVEWQTRLERGRNVLSLPVVARSAGAGSLVAVIEHQGRTRRVAVNLIVVERRRDEVA